MRNNIRHVVFLVLVFGDFSGSSHFEITRTVVEVTCRHTEAAHHLNSPVADFRTPDFKRSGNTVGGMI